MTRGSPTPVASASTNRHSGRDRLAQVIWRAVLPPNSAATARAFCRTLRRQFVVLRRRSGRAIRTGCALLSVHCCGTGVARGLSSQGTARGGGVHLDICYVSPPGEHGHRCFGAYHGTGSRCRFSSARCHPRSAPPIRRLVSPSVTRERTDDSCANSEDSFGEC